MRNVIAQNWSDPAGNQPATLEDFEVVFGKIVAVVLGFAGIALFIMLLIGGFQYLTAGGNPDKAAAARSTLTLAIVGFVLILLSLLIINLIENFTGLNISEFDIFL